jgi:hypothetical protein
MSIRAGRPSSDRNQLALEELGGDAVRVLALLAENHRGAMTIPELREHGIEAPGQEIYALQLAGYRIDRVAVRPRGGHWSQGYRLHSDPPPERLAGSSTERLDR